MKLFDRIGHWLAGGSGAFSAQGQEESGSDAGEVDFAALLVAAARADGAYTEAESDLIERILAVRSGLDMAEAATVRRRGEAAHDDASSDMFAFATGLKKRYSESQRRHILDGLWSVVLSDSQRHPREEALIRQSASLLGLSHRERIASRKRIEARMSVVNSPDDPESGM